MPYANPFEAKIRKQLYREQHREELNLKQKEIIQALRKQYIDKLGGKCVKCGSIKNLEFDHINPKDKLYNIDKILSNLELLIIELVKCQLLCFDCHVEKSTLEKAINITKGCKNSIHTCKCHTCKEKTREYRREQYWRNKVK